jgi:hypothetical protein
MQFFGRGGHGGDVSSQSQVGVGKILWFWNKLLMYQKSTPKNHRESWTMNVG